MNISRLGGSTRVIALATGIAFGLTGCATQGPQGAQGAQDNQGTQTASTDPSVGKAVGAVAGAIIGAIVGRHNRAAGAAIGALVGLAAGYAFDDYKVKQQRSAQAVNDEYRSANGGKLPAVTTITKYSTRTEPVGVIARGGQLQFISDIEVVKGSSASNRPDKIEEELILYDPSGKNEKRVRKPAVESATASGAFTTQFTFKPSEGMAQGVYAFKTVLYLNDAKAREVSGNLQVAKSGVTSVLVSMN